MGYRVQRLALLALDCAFVGASTLIALLLPGTPDDAGGSTAAVLGLYTLISVATAAIASAALRTHLIIWQYISLDDLHLFCLLSAVVVLGATLAGHYLNNMWGIPPVTPVWQVVLVFVFLVGPRLACRVKYGRRMLKRRKGSAARECVMVIGLNPLTAVYLDLARRSTRAYIDVVGVISDSSKGYQGMRIGRHELLGSVEDLDTIIATLGVHGIRPDKIVLTCPLSDLSSKARKVLHEVAVEYAVTLCDLTEKLDINSACLAAGDDPELEYIPSCRSRRGEVGSPRPALQPAKRTFDVVFSALAIVFLLPVFALVAVVVYCDVGAPLLFRQQRPGRYGVAFCLYKFRTMASPFSRRGQRLLDSQRLSRVGRILRSTRLDELPQLVNILVGDMSVVGPRPLLPVDQPDDMKLRLEVRPGLTGWAQVMGGRDITPADKAALDEWYVRHMSFWLDIKIMIRTLPMIVLGERVDFDAIRAAHACRGQVPETS